MYNGVGVVVANRGRARNRGVLHTKSSGLLRLLLDCVNKTNYLWEKKIASTTKLGN